MRAAHRRLGAALAALLALGLLTLLFPSGRRVAKVCWLRMGDLLASRPSDGAVLFDAASDADAGLTVSRGTVRVSRQPCGSGSCMRLQVPGTPGPHEVCTRRIPRDWSGKRVLRLYLGASGGADRCTAAPVPLELTLRLRSKAAWGKTRWFRHHAFLEYGSHIHRVRLEPAREFVDLTDVRQLCISLATTGRTGVLGLHQVTLGTLPVELFRTSDGPLTLHALGDSTKLRGDDAPPVEGGNTTLHGARGEVVAAQLLIRHGGRLTVRWDPLAGPDGRTLPLEVYEARWLPVREPSSGMYGPGSPGPGLYPDPLVPIHDGAVLAPAPQPNRLLWLDVAVGRGTPAGDYRTRLRLVGDGGAVEHTVQVTVHPVTLPRDSRPLVMIYYAPHLLRRLYQLEGPAFEDLERQYHRLVHTHGGYLVTDPPLEAMTRFIPMLTGALYGKPSPAPYWPVDLNPVANDRARLEVGARDAVRWFRRHAPGTRPFCYLADEPDTREDYERIRRLAAWIHSAPAPGNGLPVMVTEQVRPQQADWPSLVGAVDYWISPDNFPEPAARRRRATHERFFPYNGMEPSAGAHVIDAPGTSLRTWGWIAFLFQIDMWFYWQGAYYVDEHNGEQTRPLASLFQEPVTFDQRRHGKDADFGNGDGVLVYPPARPGGPLVPSMRLKMIRRGVQDRQYLLAARRCGQGKQALSIARRLIPRALGEARGCATAWPRAEQPWDQARLHLLTLLERCGDSPD